jgi:UDP-glucose 4-epimerase
MNIAITGYRGFIGSSLVRLYERAGFTVSCLNLPPSRQDSNAFMIELSRIEKNLDLIIHAAGIADVRQSFTRPENDFNSNTDAVFIILNALRQSKHVNTRFILLSSAAVYGEPAVLPVSTSHPIQPISPYGYHKAMAELLLKSFYVCYGMKTASLRIFSAYGENNKKQVLWELCSRAHNASGQVLEVIGTGEETRDFIYIEDIFSQINIVATKALFNGEAYNSGNGQEVEIRKIAYEIAKNMNIVEVGFTKQQIQGYPSKWAADISFMTEHGYIPSVSIEEGISRYCNWFRQLHDNE